MKRHITFPHHGCGTYGSLEEAYTALSTQPYDWPGYTLCEIVRYNRCYRDCLREQGIEILINRLLAECPALAADTQGLAYLREWSAQHPLAAYDIQCYAIGDALLILGETFLGLDDVRQRVSLCAQKGSRTIDIFTPADTCSRPGVQVARIYENYPRFDSYDECDNRCYQNYFFRTEPFAPTDLERLLETPHTSNCCMVHEQLPEALLPVLYYVGDGGYLLLATNKPQPETNEKP